MSESCCAAQALAAAARVSGIGGHNAAMAVLDPDSSLRERARLYPERREITYNYARSAEASSSSSADDRPQLSRSPLSAASDAGAGSSTPSISATTSRPASVSETSLQRRLVGSVSPHNQTAVLKVVDRHGGGRRVDGGGLGDLLDGHRLRASRRRIRIRLNGRPDRSTTARRQRVLVVEDQTATSSRQTSSASGLRDMYASRFAVRLGDQRRQTLGRTQRPVTSRRNPER